MTAAARRRAIMTFLERVFQKLLLNFTWWVNRKDADGRQSLRAAASSGSTTSASSTARSPLPSGGHLEQADGTAWMAFYCGTMLSMALELARKDPSYEDIASKFFEHFVAIADAMNTLGGTGLWDEEDGFYYDQLRADGRQVAAAHPLDGRTHAALRGRGARAGRRSIALPGFCKRMQWFLDNRPDLARHDVVHAPTRRRHGACSPFPRASASSACCGTCSTKTSSSRRTASARCRACTSTSRIATRLDGQNLDVDYKPGGVDARHLRRQLELARPGVVSGQLPAHRGAGALSPLLRRRPARRAADRVRSAREPARRSRTSCAAGC